MKRTIINTGALGQAVWTAGPSSRADLLADRQSPPFEDALSRRGCLRFRAGESRGFNPFTSFYFIVILAALGLPVSGCSKKSEVETKIAAPSEASQYAPKPQSVPASPPIAATATPEEVAGQLTLELRRYVSYTRSIPKNFEDFVANDPIQFPSPPAGKKYFITGDKVVLK